MAEIASAYVSLIPSAKGFGTKLNSEVGSSVKSSGSSLGKTFGKMFAAGAGIIAAAGIGNLLKGSIDEAREAQKVGAQTEAVLKSTGGAANISAKQIGKLATALSNKIGVDDEAIQAGENLLLTFTNVRNEAGKGNDIFNRATRTVQDMAAAFGGDATTNSKILGKALNDPIKGVSALTRVGVSFTDKQKEQIKTLVESGDTLKAQKIILGELSKESKGSAEAQVTNADKARVAYGNLKEQVGTALLPILDKLAKFVTDKVIPAVSKFISGMQDGTGAGGQFRDIVEQIVSTAKGVLDFFNGLPGPVKKFAGEVGLAALVVPKLTGAISGMKLTSFISNLSTAESRTKALGDAAKAAGGVAGMALLADSTQRSNRSLGILESTIGGAGVGFSVGGPLGAGLGALAGLELGLVSSTKEVKKSFKFVSPEAANYADQLNKISGAATQASRTTAALALQQSGALDAGKALGLSSRDLVKYVLGNESAVKKVNAAIDSASSETITWTDSLGRTKTILAGNSANAIKLNTALGRNADAFETSRKQAQDLAIANGTLSKALKGVKDRSSIITTFEQEGYPETKRQLAEILAGYKLTPKQVSTLIKATGVDASVAGVQKVIDRLKQVKDKVVNLTIRTNHIGGVTSSAGGHSSDPETPKTTQKYGKTLGEGLARGIADSTAKVGNATEGLSKKLKEKLAGVRDALASVRSDFASLVEPVASNFTQGLFDFDTAGAFTANLATVKGTLQTLLANFAKLKGEGLSPAFLYQLFQSGGPALINGLASLDAAGARSAGALFGDVMSLSDQLGTAVAGSTDKGAALENQTVRLEKKLDRLIQAVKDGDGGRGHADRAAARARRRAVRA